MLECSQKLATYSVNSHFSKKEKERPTHSKRRDNDDDGTPWPTPKNMLTACYMQGEQKISKALATQDLFRVSFTERETTGFYEVKRPLWCVLVLRLSAKRKKKEEREKKPQERRKQDTNLSQAVKREEKCALCTHESESEDQLLCDFE